MSVIKLFRSKSRDKDRFKELLRPHIEIMYRMAFRWTRSEEDAEDLVQDVLIRLAERVDEMEKINKLKPWLIKVLYHRFVDLYRREKSSPLVAADTLSQDPEDNTDPLANVADHRNGISQLELTQSLKHAIYQLDPDQTDVILMHDLEGYTVSEVADIMGTSVGTVKSRLHRARAKLKAVLLK